MTYLILLGIAAFIVTGLYLLPDGEPSEFATERRKTKLRAVPRD
jgi:hypothetical protein